MRNKHSFKEELECRCPFTNCGKIFMKTITVEVTTNQKGNVIWHRIKR